MLVNVMGMNVSARFVAWIGAIAFAACLVFNALGDKLLGTSTAATDTCKVETAGEPPKEGDKLRILKVGPEKTSFDRTICIAIAGFGTEGQELYLYLNGLVVDGFKFKPQKKEEPQVLSFEISTLEKADEKTAKLWRDLLGDNAFSASFPLTVGLSRTQTNAPNVVAPAEQIIRFVVFSRLALAAGLVALICVAVLLWILAKNSALLRDSPVVFTAPVLAGMKAQAAADLRAAEEEDFGKRSAAEQALLTAKDPAALSAQAFRLAVHHARLAEIEAQIAANIQQPATFSLARTQMAFWLVLTTASFLFIWMTTGQQTNLFNADILALLGINSATGLAAILINDGSKSASMSRGFIRDILSDGSNPQLYRIQAAVWTIILGVIFLWTVATSFRFPQIEPMLLVLMGMSGSFYLGFKWTEK